MGTKEMINPVSSCYMSSLRSGSGGWRGCDHLSVLRPWLSRRVQHSLLDLPVRWPLSRRGKHRQVCLTERADRP